MVRTHIKKVDSAIEGGDHAKAIEAYNAAVLEAAFQVRRSGQVRLPGLTGRLLCHDKGYPPGPAFGLFDLVHEHGRGRG